MAMQKVESSLAASSSSDRSALHMRACAVLAGRSQGFEGRVDGGLVWPPRGDRGSATTIFVANGYDLTFGEMEPQKA